VHELKDLLDAFKLKGKSVVERLEIFCIIFIFVGAFTLTVGIGLSILNTKGISAILAMLGSVIAFLATLTLIIVWFIKEWGSD
jgi:phage-related minor tail protein